MVIISVRLLAQLQLKTSPTSFWMRGNFIIYPRACEVGSLYVIVTETLTGCVIVTETLEFKLLKTYLLPDLENNFFNFSVKQA